jgi:hypothetical protein
MEDIIKKYYPDFDWIKYKDMNPFLFFYNLKTKEEYMNNFIKEGRYLGRKYKEEHNTNVFDGRPILGIKHWMIE